MDNFDPCSTHVIYGPDADLIMLGLLTHMDNIMILRENYSFPTKLSKAVKRESKPTEWIILYLNILKEYFHQEYSLISSQMKIPYDLNRIIDDFIFLCFFVGNDFLPRIYSFSIRLGSLEKLIQCFKSFLIQTDNYLHHRGQINW